MFDVKESRNTRNLLESCKTKPKAKRFELTCSRQFLPPSRLVVALRFFIRSFLGPPSWDPSYLALQSETTLQPAPPPVRFDSDSYPIGVDNHASKCMANAPHLFENLCLNNNKGQVDGINSGLDITFPGSASVATRNLKP